VRVAIAGGGTGGHLFPGLALAERLREQASSNRVVFFGARRGIESRLVEPAGFELIAQDLEAVSGRRPAAAVRAMAKLVRSSVVLRGELRRRHVEVVVGLGGYASAAGVVGAALARVPVVLLEQNHRPGLANRSLARLATAVCTSFEDSSRYFPTGRCRFTGNPLRADLDKTGAAEEATNLLVFGGSAGAHSLNRAVTGAIETLAGVMELPPIVHQTGADDLAEVKDAYRRRGVRADVRPFIDDMASAYRHARLAVCRAGATSVAELAATETPAVLIPFPAAAGGHQRDNAEWLVAAGAATLVSDDERAATRLAEVLKSLLLDRERLDSMAERARAVAHRGATSRVLDVLEEVCGAGSRRSSRA